MKRKREEELDHPIRFIDLFCGIGSFFIGLQSNEFECVMACDINTETNEIYEKNHNIKPRGNILDITPESIPDFDILCAGFPCEPFSKMGKRKGFEDERGELFDCIIEILIKRKPRIFVLENVPALLSHNNRKTFKEIKEKLVSCGYNVSYEVLCCKDFGVPQMRKRLFIVGLNKGAYSNVKFEFDLEKMESPTLSEFLGKNFKKKVAYTVRCGGRRSKIDSKQNWDGYWVDDKVYRLTVDDCKKLQDFPSTFEMSKCKTHNYKALGNAIPIIMTKLIGKNLLKYL
jgi:DNA (cytosine-5)-methyltransferase 1